MLSIPMLKYNYSTCLLSFTPSCNLSAALFVSQICVFHVVPVPGYRYPSGYTPCNTQYAFALWNLG